MVSIRNDQVMMNNLVAYVEKSKDVFYGEAVPYLWEKPDLSFCVSYQNAEMKAAFRRLQETLCKKLNMELTSTGEVVGVSGKVTPISRICFTAGDFSFMFAGEMLVVGKGVVVIIR